VSIRQKTNFLISFGSLHDIETTDKNNKTLIYLFILMNFTFIALNPCGLS
jgi:hypothetical protein